MSLKKILKPVRRAGYTEKNALLPDGTVIHYGESRPNGRQPILLIHGQTSAWQDYAAVLVQLSERFHVFAADCHGHGQSGKDPQKYTAEKMGADFVWFIDNVIKTPAVVSGHSSGGLLAAWLAANAPQSVCGVLLEDPPFFSTEPGGRWEKSFAYADACEPIHRFLNQTEEKDWTLFYIRHSLWGKMIGDKGVSGMLKYGAKYRKKHPDTPLHYFFLPESVNKIFWFMNEYDPRFGEAFYDSSWFENFDQTDTLKRIRCPAVLIHTKWRINDEGILIAAMSEDDAVRADRLLADSKLIHIDCGHDSHFEKPDEFLKAIDMLRDRMA